MNDWTLPDGLEREQSTRRCSTSRFPRRALSAGVAAGAGFRGAEQTRARARVCVVYRRRRIAEP